ncbi:MAG: hypothetical protein IJ048_10585 [Clostridia bacterium]|nr:hypothetical protein [Clostridia bacterium]
MTGRRWRKLLPYAMAAPALALAAAVTLGAAVNTLLEGLGWLPELGLRALGFDHFRALFEDAAFRRSLWWCLRIAAASTLLSVALGAALAGRLAASGWRWVARLARLPVILSYMAAAVLVYNAFSRYGLLYHIVRLLGVPWDGPDIVFSSSGAAVVLLYVFKGAPYIALSLAPIFTRATRELRGAAHNLGAGKMATFLRVIAPTGRRTMLTGALVLFNFDLTAYEGYAYLGCARPTALGVMALQTYQRADLRGRADGMAINAVMIGIALVSALLFSRALRREAGSA